MLVLWDYLDGNNKSRMNFEMHMSTTKLYSFSYSACLKTYSPHLELRQEAATGQEQKPCALQASL